MQLIFPFAIVELNQYRQLADGRLRNYVKELYESDVAYWSAHSGCDCVNPIGKSNRIKQEKGEKIAGMINQCHFPEFLDSPLFKKLTQIYGSYRW